MMDIDPQSVFAKIDADELVKVALDLGNIDSPTGREGPVADYVHDWLHREGFDARKIGLYPNRPNVLATLPGSGGGRSLCFNSHMDTAVHQEEWWASRHAGDRIFHSAWCEGDMLVGNGIVNDKGPMATWLLAAKAIKDSGATLKGDLVLMAVVGEIGVEPVDEFQPPDYIAKEAGHPLRDHPRRRSGLCTGGGRHRFRPRRRRSRQGILQNHRFRQRLSDLYALHPAADFV